MRQAGCAGLAVVALLLRLWSAAGTSLAEGNARAYLPAVVGDGNGAIATLTATSTASATASWTPTLTGTPSATLTATATGTATAAATMTSTATATSTTRPTATTTATTTPPPTNTTRPTATATPTKTPTPTATATRWGNCHPSYPTVCIPPPPPDLDCGDIPNRNFTVLPPDPHRFDSDKDGVGCESD